MAFNTGNPVPSTDGRDLSDNAEALDKIVNQEVTVTTRTGKIIKSIPQIVDPVDASATQGIVDINADVAAVNAAADGFDATVTARVATLESNYLFTAINGGVWAEFETFTAFNQFMVFGNVAYKPDVNVITLPYVVGASPVGDINVVPFTDQSVQNDDLSQSYTFKTVVLMKASLIVFPVGKKIFWQGYNAESDGGSNWGIVKSGAHTDDGGSVFTLADGKFVRANITGTVLVNKFGTLGDGSDSTAETLKIQAAVDYMIANQVSSTVKAGVLKFKPAREYAIEGVVIDSESTPITTIAYGCWFKLTGATGTGFFISNLRGKFFGGTFRQSSVDNDNTAIEIRQTVLTDNPDSNTFRDVDIVNVWRGLDFKMDKAAFPTQDSNRHLVDRCNIRNTTNGTKTWAGSRGISFGGDVIGDSTGNDSHVTNTLVVGYEIGIFSNGVRTSVNNSSVDGCAIGVNFAGNSCTIKDHYSEFNDVGWQTEVNANNSDIEGSFTDTIPFIDNGLRTQYRPLQPDFNRSNQTIFTPTGNQPAGTFNAGTDTLVPTMECLGTGEMQVMFNGAIQATIGSIGVSTYGTSVHELRTSSVAESGQPILFIAGSTGNITQFRPVSGANGNFTGAAMIVPADSATGRSISTGGTVVTGGADMAEYMKKSGDFIIDKGDICGIDSNGLLTKVFADSLSFVVKSTDPSYVGGDTWGSDEELGLSHPVMPTLKKPTLKKSDVKSKVYDKELTAYHKKLSPLIKKYDDELVIYNKVLEEARQHVDRIAFCGRVPVNVLGANSGDYIIPIEDNGKIKGVAKKIITFEESLIKVGKVINIADDGRAMILVSVG